MAYKINDEIFFLKIDEQVEYLTQVINELYSKDIKIINTNINNLSERINNLNDTKQDKTSDELKTEVKNIVGSINELFDKIESETNRAVNSENEISTNLTEFKDHTNTILDSHTSSISSINDSIKSLQDNKQSKIDEQLQTTSKEVVGAINENHDAIVTNEALIDTKQDKTDNSLATTNKTIVGAINEINTLLGKCLPFEDSYVSDCNSWLTNGYTKTNTSTTSHPSVCTGADRWAILFFIAENVENGTGTQMYFPIDGTYKGAVFTRSITNRSAGEWKKLATISDIPTTLPANGGNANTVGGYTIWTGTQSEYDAISSKSSTTIYFIKG